MVLETDALLAQAKLAFDTETRRALLQEIALKQYQNAQWIYLFELIQPHVAGANLDWPQYRFKPPGIEYWNFHVLKT